MIKLKFSIIVLLSVLMLYVSCVNNDKIPQIGFNDFIKSTDDFGIEITKLKPKSLFGFEETDKLLELIPEELDNRPLKLGYKLYYVIQKDSAVFISTTDNNDVIDKYSYSENVFDIVIIHPYGDKGARIVLEDKIIERDSLKSLLTPVEIDKNGYFKEKEKLESFRRFVETRSALNENSGEYYGELPNYKINLSLRDGMYDSTYNGLLEIYPPENCIVNYYIKEQNIYKSIIHFDDSEMLTLLFRDDHFLFDNRGYAICDEEISEFSMLLFKHE